MSWVDLRSDVEELFAGMQVLPSFISEEDTGWAVSIWVDDTWRKRYQKWNLKPYYNRPKRVVATPAKKCICGKEHTRPQSDYCSTACYKRGYRAKRLKKISQPLGAKSKRCAG